MITIWTLMGRSQVKRCPAANTKHFKRVPTAERVEVTGATTENQNELMPLLSPTSRHFARSNLMMANTSAVLPSAISTGRTRIVKVHNMLGLRFGLGFGCESGYSSGHRYRVTPKPSVPTHPHRPRP